MDKVLGLEALPNECAGQVLVEDVLVEEVVDNVVLVVELFIEAG